MDAEEFREEQVREELHRFQEVSGVYRGAIRREGTNEWIGAVEAELEADTEVQRRGDPPRYEEIPVFKIRLSLETEEAAYPVVFSKVSYGTSSGILKGALPIRVDAEQSQELLLSGVLSGGVLRGRLGVFGRKKSQGNFVLVRDAEPAKPEKGESSEDFWKKQKVFEGKGKFPHLGTRSVSMSLVSDLLTTEEELLRIFSPLKKLRATLGLTRTLDIVFENALWDEEAHTLSGVEDIVTTGFGSTRVKLECKERVRGKGKSLSCQVGSSLRRERIALTLNLSTRSEPAVMTSLYRRLRYVSEATIGEPYQPTLLLESLPESGASDFLQIFNYSRMVRLVFGFTPDVNVGVEQANWYLDSDTLVGKSNFISNGGTYETQVDCRERFSGGRHIGWRCTYSSTLTGVAREFLFVRARE